MKTRVRSFLNLRSMDEVPEEKEPGFSEDVIVHDLKNNITLMGFYDYEEMEWVFHNSITDGIEDFVWMPVPEELKRRVE